MCVQWERRSIGTAAGAVFDEQLDEGTIARLGVCPSPSCRRTVETGVSSGASWASGTVAAAQRVSCRATCACPLCAIPSPVAPACPRSIGSREGHGELSHYLRPARLDMSGRTRRLASSSPAFQCTAGLTDFCPQSLRARRPRRRASTTTRRLGHSCMLCRGRAEQSPPDIQGPYKK